MYRIPQVTDVKDEVEFAYGISIEDVLGLTEQNVYEGVGRMQHGNEVKMNDGDDRNGDFCK